MFLAAVKAVCYIYWFIICSFNMLKLEDILFCDLFVILTDTFILQREQARVKCRICHFDYLTKNVFLL